MLKIFCSLLGKHQRGIIFTTHCHSWIIFPIFLFSSSLLHVALASLKLSAPPFRTLSKPPTSAATSPLPPLHSEFLCFLLPHHTKIVAKTTERNLPGCCAQERIRQRPSPQLSLPARTSFSGMTHFPTDGPHPHHFLFCPLLPRARIWEQLMTEPDREEIILLGCQRGVMSQGKEENQMVRFVECFISTVNCFIYLFFLYWALPNSLVGSKWLAVGNALTLSSLPRSKASFQFEDMPIGAILILGMMNFIELPCI